MSTTPPGDPEQPTWQPPPMAAPPSYPPPGPPYGGAPAPGYGENPYGGAPAPGYGDNPYGPGAQPAPGYGGAPYGYGYGYQQPRDHPQGGTILVLGILGLVFCQILGPIAWVMGNTAMREIDANPGAYSNRSTVQAGRICGMVATALIVLSILALIMVFALAASAGTSSY